MSRLYEQLPNFTEALDDVKRHVALAQDCRDGLEVTPMLLLGPPGIGNARLQGHEAIAPAGAQVPTGSTRCGSLNSHLRAAANTAPGYSARPRLPL